jgi:hypothetical protein
MSHAQTRCTPHFDKNSMDILNQLGYGCSYNDIPLEELAKNTNTTLWLIGGGCLAVVIIVVVLWLCNKSKDTKKKRNL